MVIWFTSDTSQTAIPPMALQTLPQSQHQARFCHLRISSMAKLCVSIRTAPCDRRLLGILPRRLKIPGKLCDSRHSMTNWTGKMARYLERWMLRCVDMVPKACAIIVCLSNPSVLSIWRRKRSKIPLSTLILERSMLPRTNQSWVHPICRLSQSHTTESSQIAHQGIPNGPKASAQNANLVLLLYNRSLSG